MSGETKTITERGPVVVGVTKEHHIAGSRGAARALAEAISFRGAAAFYVATCVTELAHNLIRHATRGGTITVTALRRSGEIGIEVVAEDDGPGIPDVAQAMRDGFSTSGGLGGGLPGVKRLMDELEITSTAGVGTRVVARKWQPCR